MSGKEWNFLSLEQKVRYLYKFVQKYERAPNAIEEFEGALVGSFWKNLRYASRNKRYVDTLDRIIKENRILHDDYINSLK